MDSTELCSTGGMTWVTERCSIAPDFHQDGDVAVAIRSQLWSREQRSILFSTKWLAVVSLVELDAHEGSVSNKVVLTVAFQRWFGFTRTAR